MKRELLTFYLTLSHAHYAGVMSVSHEKRDRDDIYRYRVGPYLIKALYTPYVNRPNVLEVFVRVPCSRFLGIFRQYEWVRVYRDGWEMNGPWQDDIPRLLQELEAKTVLKELDTKIRTVEAVKANPPKFEFPDEEASGS